LTKDYHSWRLYSCDAGSTATAYFYSSFDCSDENPAVSSFTISDFASSGHCGLDSASFTSAYQAKAGGGDAWGTSYSSFALSCPPYSGPVYASCNDVPFGSPSGTYHIRISNVPTRIYCELLVNGGGWASFAYAPATGSGDWLPAAYMWDSTWSYGTYDPTGSRTVTNGYFRDYRTQTPAPTEIMFMTGNKRYYQSLLLSDFFSHKKQNGGTASVYSVTGTSNNFETSPPSGMQLNNFIAVLWRESGGEDPWINPGNEHGNGAAVNDMFWGGHACGASLAFHQGTSKAQQMPNETALVHCLTAKSTSFTQLTIVLHTLLFLYVSITHTQTHTQRIKERSFSCGDAFYKDCVL